jgi:hypothetical protein
MPSVTLAESAKLAQNELVAGVIEDVITVNQMFEVVPFDGIEGNALAYNRENALGDVEMVEVDDQITADAAATFTDLSVQLTTILGNAKVNGLIQATRSGDGNDQTAIQIASKAKSAGRQWQDQFINGSGVAPEFQGLISACASSQKVDTDTNGGPLSFDFLDELMDLVVDKDGQVDFICSHARTRRSYKALLRALGGASILDTVNLPSGAEVLAYGEAPWFRNDYIPVNQSKGASENTTTIFAGTFDDGSRQHGLAGLTAEREAGIQVVDVGEEEDRDNRIWRVKWYTSLVIFSEKGLACAEGITN